jgi:hypothetical protein
VSGEPCSYNVREGCVRKGHELHKLITYLHCGILLLHPLRVKAVLPKRALRVVGHVVKTTVHTTRRVRARVATRGGRTGGGPYGEDQRNERTIEHGRGTPQSGGQTSST